MEQIQIFEAENKTYEVEYASNQELAPKKHIEGFITILTKITHFVHSKDWNKLIEHYVDRNEYDDLKAKILISEVHISFRNQRIKTKSPYILPMTATSQREKALNMHG